MTDNDIVFDSIHIAETYYLHNDTSKPSCNLQIQFLFPKSYKNEKILAKAQSMFIEKFFGEDFAQMKPAEAVQNYKERYIAEFKEFEKEFGEGSALITDEESDETGHSYYATLQNSIPFNKNNLISFTVEYSNYEGGAHGSHSIYGYIFDLTNGTLISEDQIFTENYKKELASIIVNKIAEINNIKDSKDLPNVGYGSIDDIFPNGNLIIDEKGITYFFNENEIAGYVVGITKVFIPYEEISIYMSKDSPTGKLAGL
jgi:hypothetical protein